MTATTATPPAVRAVLLESEFKALDRNLHRHVEAVRLRRAFGIGAPRTVNYESILDRAATHITTILEGGIPS